MKIGKNCKSENTFPIIALICAILSAWFWGVDISIMNVFTKSMEIIAIALSITSLEQKRGSRIIAISALIIAIAAVFAVLFCFGAYLLFFDLFGDDIWDAFLAIGRIG